MTADRQPVNATLNFSPHGTPAEIVELAFYQAVLDGEAPHTAEQAIAAADPTSLLPPGTAVIRSASDEGAVSLLARVGAVTVLLRGNTRIVHVAAAGPDPDSCRVVLEEMSALAPRSDADDRVPVRVWHHGGIHVLADDRRLEAPPWPEIAFNYPGRVRQRLEALMGIERPERGRLVLWHGDAGTGKTTALRALIRAWSPWCSAHYVADPERLFADPGYLLSVLHRPEAGEGPMSQLFRRPGRRVKRAAHSGRWRLVVAEDSDEYLRVSARREAGAAMGRLLNLTDGLLGQGTPVIVLLTTNESLARLHPAVVRPGRCLDVVHFARFEPAEAARFLAGAAPTPAGPATLAELLARRGDLPDVTTDPDPDIGLYL